MATTYIDHVASGSTDTFAIPCPYIDKTHIVVLKDGVVVPSNQRTFPSSSTIKLNAGNPTVGQIIRVQRVTPAAPIVTIVAGNYDPKDLNLLGLQSLYRTEEAKDFQDLLKTYTDSLFATTALHTSQIATHTTQIAGLGTRVGVLENGNSGGPGLTGRPIVILSENQSNGALEDADPTYEWPPNLYIWEWDGMVHPDTFIGSNFFQPQYGITKMRYARDAAARVARRNPRSPVYLIDFSVGGQYLAQWRTTYPATPNNPTGTTALGPIVGGGAVVGGLVYWDMRKIRDQNMPVAMLKTGVKTIDYYLMWQGENEANIQALSFIPFLAQRNEHHTTLRTYDWFPYETPFIQMTMCPYAYALNNYNRLLKAWAMRERQTRIIGDNTFIPAAMWPDNLHIQGAAARKMAGGAAAAAMMGRSVLACSEQRVPLMVTGSNVASFINGLAQYSYDGQNVTEHGRFYLTPTAGGGTLTTITLPFEYEFSIQNPSWDVSAVAYDGTSQTTLPVTIVQTSTTAALVIFKPTTTNLWTISYSGGGRLSNA